MYILYILWNAVFLLQSHQIFIQGINSQWNCFPHQHFHGKLMSHEIIHTFFMTHKSNSVFISWPIKRFSWLHHWTFLVCFHNCGVSLEIHDPWKLSSLIHGPLNTFNFFSPKISWPQMRSWKIILQDSLAMKWCSWYFQVIFMGFSQISVSYWRLTLD